MTKPSVYDFASELLGTGQVSDASYAGVNDRFGERGVMDLVGAVGYYSLVSMVLNVDRGAAAGGRGAAAEAAVRRRRSWQRGRRSFLPDRLHWVRCAAFDVPPATISRGTGAAVGTGHARGMSAALVPCVVDFAVIMRAVRSSARRERCCPRASRRHGRRVS